MQRPTQELIALFRVVLQEVQESVWKDTPAVREMYCAVLEAIAVLESEGERRVRPFIVPKR